MKDDGTLYLFQVKQQESTDFLRSIVINYHKFVVVQSAILHVAGM